MGNKNCKLDCLNKKFDEQTEFITNYTNEFSNQIENDHLNDLNDEKYFKSNKKNNALTKGNNNNNQEKQKKNNIEPIEEINNKIEPNIYINEEGKIINKKYRFNNTIEESPNEYYITNASKLKDKIIDDDKKIEDNEEIKEIKEEKSESEFIKATIVSSPMRKIEENEIEEQIDKNLIPEDDFSKYIFEQINLLRQNPKHFIKEIKENKSKIKKNKINKFIFNSTLKVALEKGEVAFDKAIEELEKTEPMNKLIYFPKLTIPLPENENDLIKKQYLKEKISQLKYFVKINWKENIKDPFICFLLMVVDDTKKEESMKRKCILDPEIKYIGICSKSIGKNFCCYLTFSNKLKKNQEEILNN